MLGVPVFKASAIISEEWKKVKASDKKMKSKETFTKKRNDDMKRQRYQEGHMNEM